MELNLQSQKPVGLTVQHYHTRSVQHLLGLSCTLQPDLPDAGREQDLVEPLPFQCRRLNSTESEMIGRRRNDDVTVVILGVVAVAVAPLFTARRMRRMDLPGTLRLVE